MLFDIPKPYYTFDYNGWYKIKSSKGFGFAGMKIHYFFKSQISLCGLINDQCNKLIKCDDVKYKRCKKCMITKNTYSDLNNILKNTRTS